MSGREVVAFIGIGSNLEDPLSQCRRALEKIATLKETKILRVSSYYRTEPIGVKEQNYFINAVAELRTSLAPQELLSHLQRIEKEMGRKESCRWGPRIIDLDILLYGQEIVEDENLVIPHPECHKRWFVLIPCCELAPYAIHPAFGISLQGLLGRLEMEDGSDVEKLPMKTFDA